MDKPQSTFGRIYEDLRRRKVFRATALYGVIAWFVIQAAEATFDPLNLPQYTHRIVVIAALAGFPIVVILAWLYDLTSRGFIRTPAAVAAVPGRRERIVDFVVIGILAALVVYLWLKPGTPTSSSGGTRSIAVLPFDDFSEGRDQAYFGDGIAEELLNALVGVEGLRVAARTSSFAFRGTEKDVRLIGQQLDVDTVLEGSVRRSGDRVKITAQLIETKQGYHLWSQVYDRQLTDIFAVQEDISRSIAEELKLRLSGTASAHLASAPANIQAYDLYLLGRHHWRERTPESLEQARELFAEAVRLDPHYAPAFSGLADTYLLLSESQYGTLSQAEVLQHAEPAIARALELDGGLAEAYASLGLLRWSVGEMSLAQLALRKAVDLNPSYSMAHMWLGSVLVEDDGALLAAQFEYALAYQLDPLQNVIGYNYASMLGQIGQLDEAKRVVNRLAEQSPASPQPYLALADLAETSGRLDEAIYWVERAQSVPHAGSNGYAFLSRLRAQLGQYDEARAALEQARAAGAPDLATQSSEAFLVFLQADWKRLAALADPIAPPESERPARGYLAQKTRAALFWSAIARLGLGEYEAAIQRLERLDLDADSHGAFGTPRDRLGARNAWAFALQRLGRAETAQAVLDRTLEIAAAARASGWSVKMLGFATGETYALLGRRDEALAAIDAAMAAGAMEAWYLERLPTFDVLRADPAFEAMRARLEARLEEQRARAGDRPLDATTS
jgi:TolB-like protein/tetratricopeptide (TPR) repeat protein